MGAAATASFLKSALARIMNRFSVILCIDALDECAEKPTRKLIEYLKHLLSSLPSTESRLGICLSCRQHPVLDLSGGPNIVPDKENSTDIDTFIQARFSTINIDPLIQESICSRAQGVFMWAYLVVGQVLEMKRQFESNAKIKAEIEKIPTELGKLYCELIQGVKDRSGALKLMQWICFSIRPLRTVEMQWAMSLDPDYAYKSLDECYHSDDFITDENIDGRIKILSCGLAEIVPSTNWRGNEVHVVQFIHQSVQDFFIERGLLLLGQTCEPDLVGPIAHCRLSRSCLRYRGLVAKYVRGDIDKFDESDEDFFPLLYYTVESWVSHVKLGEPAETSPGDLLGCFGWLVERLIQPGVNEEEAMGPMLFEGFLRGLMLTVSKSGLMKLLSYLLATGKVDVNSKDKNGQTPFYWAVMMKHEAVVKMLLATDKVDVNSKDKYGRTPLFLAAITGHESVVQMLLDTGKVDIYSKDLTGRTPLSLAADKGHEAAVKMLHHANSICQ